MKRIYLLFFLISINFGLFAQSETSLEKYLESNKEAYLNIKVESKEDVRRINELISVDIIDDENVGIYVTKSNLANLNSLEIDYEILTHPSKLFVPKMYDGTKGAYEWDAYPTYDAYISMMEEFAANYPEICEVFSIGESEEGRELKFVKISDNIGENEAEPRFLYTGTMHGDETAGYIVLLRLIDYLTSNYGTDAEVTEMVDNLEIWINPNANPDGTYAAGNNTVFGATRSNANGVNLNRNYPDPQDGPHPDGEEYQSETLAFMDMADNFNFVISANTHGGAEVVNYPWDTWYSLHPDDDWWQFVSHEFADTAQFYSPAGYLNGFNDGITNGAEWYSIAGGRQDFMNYFHNCREVTLEISNTKLLPENQLEAHWGYLYRSFINYMKQSYYGVRGVVTDASTNEPLSAMVEITDHDFQNSHVYSSEDFGDYYRYLKEGTYDLTFSKEGYLPNTISVNIVDYETTILDVELISASLVADFIVDAANINIGETVQFTEQCFGEVDSYSWTFEGGNPSTSSDANPSVSYEQEGSFDVSLTITSGGDDQTITKENFINVSEYYVIENSEITSCSGLFIDDGGLDGNYSDNKDFQYTIYGSSPINEAVLEVEFTEFNIESEASCDYDYLSIYNGVGTSAELVGTYCGTDSPGIIEANNVDNALTFVFHSDGSVNGPGWVANIDCLIIDQIGEISEEVFQVYPNPAMGMVNISSDRNIEQVEILNIAGQLIRKENISSKNVNIDISDIQDGLYILRIKSTNQFYSKKLEIR